MFLKTVLILRIFTSHYVSINSIFTLTKVRPPMAFTSHYVSINSSRRNASIFELANLHPTMYLLILFIQLLPLNYPAHLHPTMYLLILFLLCLLLICLIHLHPTMYLLIPCCRLLFPLVADNLHPTMYLLIRKFFTTYKRVSVFTSHYVSINSVA